LFIFIFFFSSPPPPPPPSALPVFEATRKGKKSKEGFVVNTWESNSVGAPAQKAAHQSIKKIDGGYFRSMTVRRRRGKKADHKKTEKALKLTWKNTHTKKQKRTIYSFRNTKKHPIRERFFLSSFRESPFFAGEVICVHARAHLRSPEENTGLLVG